MTRARLALLVVLFLPTLARAQQAGSPNVRGFVSTAAPSYTDQTYANLSLDPAGNLRVVTTGGSGLSVTDQASWTAGSSAFTPTGGEYNPTAAPLAAGQQGTLGLTANRAALASLRDSVGHELGASQVPGQPTVPLAVALVPQSLRPPPTLSRGVAIVTVPQGQALGTPVTFATVMGGQSSTGLRPGVFCDRSASIDTAASGATQLVALASGKTIYVCGLDWISTAALSVNFVYGTGTNCGTGTTNLEGAQAVAANGGKVIPVAMPKWFVPAGQALCINLSGATQVSGSVTFTQF